MPARLSATQQDDLKKLTATVSTRQSMRIRVRPPRPQKKKETGRIPRPMNCFMAYRLEKQKVIAAQVPGANHRDISKVVAKWWGEEPERVKQVYRAQAEKAKEEHFQRYPNYKYRPQRKRAATATPPLAAVETPRESGYEGLDNQPLPQPQEQVNWSELIYPDGNWWFDTSIDPSLLMSYYCPPYEPSSVLTHDAALTKPSCLYYQDEWAMGAGANNFF